MFWFLVNPTVINNQKSPGKKKKKTTAGVSCHLTSHHGRRNPQADTEQKRSEHLSYVNEVTEAIHQAGGSEAVDGWTV